MARRAIMADEALVRAADRIRWRNKTIKSEIMLRGLMLF